MKYLTMTLPDDPAELRTWLETIIAHGDAGRLADELAVIHPTPRSRTVSLSADITDAVRQRGLTALDDRQLQTVLGNPRVLRSLAEDVFLHGGAYWSQRFVQDFQFDDRVIHGWHQLQTQLFPNELLVTPMVTLAVAPKPRRTISPWLASFATAAVIFLAIYLIPRSKTNIPVTNPPAVASTRWGWQRADELAAITKPADYLDRIADLADEWKAQQTPTALALSERITEFRHGCTRIQLMEHNALNAEQRQDLLSRCQKWAKKFDQNLIDLETTGDTEKVRLAMDTTVTQLTTVLREQAVKLRT